MRVLSLLVALFALTPAVQAQELFVFANEGQSQDQQDLDTVQCQRMATERTGFDPMATPTATRPPPQQQGGVVGGAARGALLGTDAHALFHALTGHEQDRPPRWRVRFEQGMLKHLRSNHQDLLDDITNNDRKVGGELKDKLAAVLDAFSSDFA